MSDNPPARPGWSQRGSGPPTAPRTPPPATDPTQGLSGRRNGQCHRPLARATTFGPPHRRLPVHIRVKGSDPKGAATILGFSRAAWWRRTGRNRRQTREAGQRVGPAVDADLSEACALQIMRCVGGRCQDPLGTHWSEFRRGGCKLREFGEILGVERRVALQPDVYVGSDGRMSNPVKLSACQATKAGGTSYATEG